MSFTSDNAPPFSVVRSIRVRNRGVNQLMPILFVEAHAGDVSVVREAATWAIASSSGYSPSSVEQGVRTLARFFDFYRTWSPSVSIEPREIDYLVYAYIMRRHSGTLDKEGRCDLGGLNWKPISYLTLRAEFAALVRYFHYCANTFGHINISPDLFSVSPREPLFDRLREHEKRIESDFFAHLAAAREYWRLKAGHHSFDMPRVSKPPHKAVTYRRFPTTDEIWTVIENEKNPIYRSLWLAGAFGGLRISEQLNAWQSDILPAYSRQFFFNESATSPQQAILYLRTDPVNSRYLDDPGSRGETRRQHLASKYGLHPRCLLPRSDPYYAGWKGTVYSGEQLTHPVFWISDRAAHQFAECAKEIRQFHSRHKTSRLHPWYYVNIADPTSEYRGLPLKIGRVERALDLAFTRVGLTPHRWGRNLHGFRHHYKWLSATELNLKEHDIQIMLGHKSIRSQSEYGKNANTVLTVLTAALANRQSKEN